MKWIKASERLPDKNGRYCIKDYRHKADGKNGSALFSESNSGKHNSLFYICPKMIEWLDETENETIPNVSNERDGYCRNGIECGCSLDSHKKCFVPYYEAEQEPCNFCGKTLREQMKGCNEISCYRQHLK